VNYKEMNEKEAYQPNRTDSGPGSREQSLRSSLHASAGVSANRRIGAVPIVGRAPTALTRARAALARAREGERGTRATRARPKREVAAGRIELARLLAEPPSCVQTAKVRELLLLVPRIGAARADRLLARSRIAHAKTVASLSERQRAGLVALLTR
jgi:hypothetical protein